MAKLKKKVVDRDPKRLCDECKGEGCVWSEKSLQVWGDRPLPPPNGWRDKNCAACKGAGWINTQTGGPLFERLIPSARPRVKREIIYRGR